jgi:UTP--glucose-1-phosphate uridylyltransferase
MPKEMMPIIDKPIIQYVVEELVDAGIKDIIIVGSSNKRTIEDHFDYSFELSKTLVEKNKLDLVEKVEAIEHLAKFSYVRQSVPLGDGHAINCAAHLIQDDEPVLIMFGDTLYDAPVSPVTQLIEAYQKYQAPIVGLAEVEPKDLNKFGVMGGDDLGNGEYRIKKFVEKPQADEAPSNLVAVGLYIITPLVFSVLKDMKSGASGEIRLSDAFNILLAQGQPLYGLKLKGEWLDTGNKFNFIKATLKLGIKDEEIGDDLKDLIKKMAQNL